MQLRNAAVQVRSRGIIILQKDGLLKGCVMANHEEGNQGLIHHLYVLFLQFSRTTQIYTYSSVAVKFLPHTVSKPDPSTHVEKQRASHSADCEWHRRLLFHTTHHTTLIFSSTRICCFCQGSNTSRRSCSTRYVVFVVVCKTFMKWCVPSLTDKPSSF